MDPHANVTRRSAIVAMSASAAIAATTSGPRTAAGEGPGKTFVLVHPAWFGGWCWKKLSPLLRAKGHEVFAPTLTGLGERAHLARPEFGLEANVEDIVNVLEFEDLRNAVLVGNSSAGMVITGVADRVPERVAHLIYLDAFVPEDGQSMLDVIPPDRRPLMIAFVEKEGSGWLLPRFAAPPWERIVPETWQVTDRTDLDWALARLRPTPFGHFRDPVRRRNPDAEKLLRTYIRTRWPHPGLDRYAAAARSSSQWTSRELATSHLPFITHPIELADMLVEVTS
jgi:pimeloyl-ACP methyl ester carboxylesterase